jgi:hypothetical protein
MNCNTMCVCSLSDTVHRILSLLAGRMHAATASQHEGAEVRRHTVEVVHARAKIMEFHDEFPML